MIGLSASELADVVGGCLHGADCHFQGLSTDSRSVQPQELFCALTGPSFDGNQFIAAAAERGAAAALCSRADPALPCVEVADTLPALGLLAKAWRARFNAPCVGITGSNGKTTVKEMTVRIAAQAGSVLATRGNLNNEIGVPLTLAQLGRIT